uniref:Evasin n=1 Tax=Amblyomma cajennense TaxID=34607 RepID=A0A023FUW1_AMBCJ
MAFLWIFALAIVAVATAEEAPGPAPGCGEPETTTPKPRRHGIVTNVNLCNRTILEWNGRELPASCTVHCPNKRRDWVTNRMPCLKFSNKTFLLERKDGAQPKYTCRVGFCFNGRCEPKRPLHKVPCTVPADRDERNE